MADAGSPREGSNPVDERGNNDPGGKKQSLLSERHLPNSLIPELAEEKVGKNEEDLSEEAIMDRLKKLEMIGDKKLTIFTCDNAVLFFISPKGEVTCTSESYRLAIWKASDDSLGETFLEVGTWIYPLFASVSEFHRSNEGFFIFPDIYSDDEGATVALYLPEAECQAFYEVLCIILNRSSSDSGSRDTRSISDKMDKGSTYISSKLVAASEKAASYMDKFTSNMVASSMADREVEVNPYLTASARMAGKVTGHTATASSYLSSRLRNAVVSLAHYVSPYIRNKISEANIPEGALNVVSTVVSSGLTVYNSLEESAAILTGSIADNTVKIVEHRYGQPTAHLTKDVLSTIGNIYSTRRNLQLLKPKSIARTAIRSTGQSILEDYRNLTREQNPMDFRVPAPDPNVTGGRLQLL